MPKISKIRIVNFAYNDGKRLIADELFDLQSNENNKEALNVLINLANGGGKSVLVQAMMQPILPGAKVEKRRIASFFRKPKDHSFIVLEWLVDGTEEKFLTGISLTAADSNTENYDRIRYYTFCAEYKEENVPYDIVHLELSSRENGHFVPASFQYVRELAKKNRNDLLCYASEDRAAWKNKLEEKGIVQAEWQNIEQYNSVEGGLKDYFDGFHTSDQLIDQLLIPAVESSIHHGEQEKVELRTQFMDYVGRYYHHQDTIQQREVYKSFQDALTAVRPNAEALCNKQYEKEDALGELYAFSMQLNSVAAKQEEKIQSCAEEIRRCREELDHIQWEMDSKEYYESKDAFYMAESQLQEKQFAKENADQEKAENDLRCKIQKSAREQEDLFVQIAQICACNEQIENQLNGSDDSARIASLKYSVKAQVSALHTESKTKLASINAECIQMEAEKKDIDQKDQQLRAEIEKLNNEIQGAEGELKQIKQQTDRLKDKAALKIERSWFEDAYELSDVEREEGNVQQSLAKCISDQKVCEQKLQERKAEQESLPQKMADIRIGIEQKQRKKQDLENRLAQYDQEEQKILQFCREYSCDPAGRFTDVLGNEVKDQQRKFHADQNICERKITVLEEEIRAAENGSVHVPQAVIRYLNDNQIVYNTCENYLLKQVKDGMIALSECEEILKVNPVVAFGICLNKENLKRMSGISPEKWLPAVVPVFTMEELETVLKKQPVTGRAIACYAADYFEDRDHFIANRKQNLQNERDNLALLKKQGETLDQMAQSILAFGDSYSENWRTAQVEQIAYCDQQISTKQKEQMQYGQQLQKVKEDVKQLEQKREEFRAQQNRLEDQQQILEDIKVQIAKEAEYADAISAKKSELQKQNSLREQYKAMLEKLAAKLEEQKDQVKQQEKHLQEYEEVLSKVENAKETEFIQGQWQQLYAELNKLEEEQNSTIKELKIKIEAATRAKQKAEQNLGEIGLSKEQYENVSFDQQRYDSYRNKENILAENCRLADRQLLAISNKHAVAKDKWQAIEKKVQQQYESVLEPASIGQNFAVRTELCKSNLQKAHDEKTESETYKNQLRQYQERTEEVLEGTQKPEKQIRITLEHSLKDQFRSLNAKYKDTDNQVKASHRAVTNQLNSLKNQYTSHETGLPTALESMIDLMDRNVTAGDRYYTLLQQMEGTLTTVEKAISKIDKDLQEFEKSRSDLIYTCHQQGRRICEGLASISASSNVTVYKGASKKRMLQINIPTEISEDNARALIAAEIDQGTEEVLKEFQESGEDSAKALKLADHIISSANLLRKYIGQESIEVRAYKIDRDPDNAGYRDWKQTQVNNSGAEKFVVYFAVVLSLISFSRRETNGINNKELRSVLILDNPFGATSSRHILEPMFAIAKQFRVQMICLSDINKTDVLNCFDMVIKAIIRKRSPLSSDEMLTHEGNENIEHGFYKSEQMSLL